VQALRRVSYICGIDGDELDGEGRAWTSVQVRERKRGSRGRTNLSFPTLFWFFLVLLLITLCVSDQGSGARRTVDERLGDYISGEFHFLIFLVFFFFHFYLFISDLTLLDARVGPTIASESESERERESGE
jgi:hypothetical protein